ncbi:MAG: formimidoylglutamase [Legionella sp.]|nr:MAG: formimidoylglutamase [Legionella sp.]PJD99869.1 MAG: formimidoylglutamase [Legionella sp.]
MSIDLADYAPPNPDLWQGRMDTEDPERFFQKVRCISSLDDLKKQPSSIVFLGFASDTGIKRNQGRAGAHLGPSHLKAQLAKLPSFGSRSYIDLGTIHCQNDDLESAQTQCAKLVDYCHQYGHTTVVLGGGHEVAWAHYQGLASHYPKIGIINFDAHFDLRPHNSGEPGTSGTPFSQIAAFCEKQNRPFQYCCVGIQQEGNTASLFKRAKELNVSYLSAKTLNQQNTTCQLAYLDNFLLHTDSVYLSICLDVFAECYAPGVSAPQPLGLTPWQVLPLLKYIIQSGKVVSLDIAELSPPLDQDQKTARLAALILAELLNCKQGVFS